MNPIVELFNTIALFCWMCWCALCYAAVAMALKGNRFKKEPDLLSWIIFVICPVVIPIVFLLAHFGLVDLDDDE